MCAKLSLCFLFLIFVIVQSQNNPYRNNLARILRLDSNVRNNGYDFVYETDDPIFRQESGVWQPTGELAKTGEALGANRVNGYAYYNLGDGTPFTLTFDADEYGYRPRYTIGAPVARAADSKAPRPPRQ